MKIICTYLFLAACTVFANVNNFKLQLDEFTLAKSAEGLNDTIDVTSSAWTNADSLHLTIYICGNDFEGSKCRVLARDFDNKLFELHFTNQGMAMKYSIPTAKINPDKIKFMALTMGLSPQDNRLGLNYRMGYLRFI